MTVEMQFIVRCDRCQKGYRVTGVRNAREAIVVIDAGRAKDHLQGWAHNANEDGEPRDVCPDCIQALYTVKPRSAQI